MPMKPYITTIICSLLYVIPLSAQDIRDKVSKGTPKANSPLLITPGKTILGFAIGTTEEDVIKKLGKPTAYMRLDPINTAFIHESNTAFIFTNGKLTGVRISYSLIDHHLSSEFSGAMGHRQPKWKLNNGIKYEMSLVAVKKILGDKLVESSHPSSKHHQKYREGNSVIHLYFSHYTSDGDTDTAYKIHGIMVIKD